MSVDRETIVQAITAGALQVALTAATRTMRVVPRAWIGAAACTVVVAHLRAAVGTTVGPVAAGMIVAVCKCGAVELRSRQDIVAIR